MFTLADDAPGTTQLLMGNEAIARGALEAGVRVAAAYPGTPSTEVIESLARVAKRAGIYVEWSTNEKVAVEVVAGASFAGLRAITAMKHEGMNVAMDFLAHLNLTGIRGGLVVVVADDPGAWSSPSENDSRAIASWLRVPLLEPASPQEALTMTRWAYDFSEEFRTWVMLRSCTRVSHASGNVVVGELPKTSPIARFDTSRDFLAAPAVQKHAARLAQLPALQAALESSPFITYEGPPRPDLLVVASGVARLYAAEALAILGLQKSVGILHVGVTWPLPRKAIEEHLARAEQVLVLEEVDPFLEGNLRDLAGEVGWLTPKRSILGKRTGHIEAYGELTPQAVLRALALLLKVEFQPRSAEYEQKAQRYAQRYVVNRGIVWCPGCPHRGSLWAVKQAIRLDGRDGFVTGDIGCYAMDRGLGGYQMTKTGSVMGAGTGIASGLGKLAPFGFNQPVVAVAGDSTFYHACIPALINARYNKSNFTLLVLDNSATAMTGFQPHPGVGKTAQGDEAPVVDIEALCRGLGIPVQVFDPFDLDKTIPALVESLQKQAGVRVFIMRRPCVLLRPRDAKPPFRVWVDPERCLGDACGCGRYCIRIFKCPGLTWDATAGKTKVDEALCAGCGLCTAICPANAIQKEAVYA
ncbi:Oxalate oxidoreductase subunit alpha [bacterium HR23]|nr:Oxalate oxidoreductase subunit alpha [bacterium HR23]